MSIKSGSFAVTELTGEDAEKMLQVMSAGVTNPLAKVALAKARIRRGDNALDYTVEGDTPEERRESLQRIIQSTKDVAKRSSEETDQRLGRFTKGED